MTDKIQKIEKTIVLGVSFIGVIMMYAFKNSVSMGLCAHNDYSCRWSFDLMEHLLYFAVPIFVTSALIYKMKDSVFAAWWKFAKWSIPIIFVLLYLINIGILHPGYSGGLMGWGGLFDEVIDLYTSVALYLIFIIGSLVQIYRGYKARV